MSLAIKFGDENDPNSLSGAVYFDAVTNYMRNLSGKVTEHPIEVGAFIVDHFVSDSPKYSISGVLSHIDFTSIPAIPGMMNVGGIPIINPNSIPSKVSVSDSTSNIAKYLPDFISQYIDRTNPEILGDVSSRTNHSEGVYEILKTIMSGVRYNDERRRFENRMTLITLFDIDGTTAINPVSDLVMVKFSTRETPDVVDALVFDMELQQVSFVESSKTTAPKPRPKSQTAKKVSKCADKGVKTPTSTSSGSDAFTKSIENNQNYLKSLGLK